MQSQYMLALTPVGFKKMHYAYWQGYGQGQGGYCTICVHGMSRNYHDFDFLGQELSKNGFNVYCPDILGRGKSDYLPDSSLYNFTQYLNDLNALIARIGSDQINWVGTSMGGLLGIILASQPNTPIKKLVLNDIGPFVSVEILQKVRTVLSRSGPFQTHQEAIDKMRDKLSTFGPLTQDQWDYILPLNIIQNPDSTYRFPYDPNIIANNPENDINLWSLWGQIKCPIFVIRGEQSQVMTLEILEQMKQVQPDIDILTIPHTGHAPMLMDSNQIQQIKDFLKK